MNGGASIEGADGGSDSEGGVSGDANEASSNDGTTANTAMEPPTVTTRQSTPETTVTTEAPTTTATPTTTTRTPTTTPTTTEPAEAEEPEPQSFEGSGSSVESGINVEGGLVVVELTHDGDSNFQAQLINSDGDPEYLTNAIGDYDGRVAIYAPAGEYKLDIEADGDWTATVRQPRFSEADVDSASDITAEGSQHDYIGPLSFDGGETVIVHAEGEGHLAVWLTDHRGEKVDLLANDIAPYESESVVTDSGVGLIVIETDRADWRIEIRE